MAFRSWRPFKKFQSEEGGITIEAVLWLPLFLGFMAFITDVALILHAQAKVQRIAQDGNRGLSTGLYQSPAEAQAAVEAGLVNIASSATVLTEETDGVIRTLVRMNSSDLVAVGLISRINDVDLSFATFHIIEA